MPDLSLVITTVSCPKELVKNLEMVSKSKRLTKLISKIYIINQSGTSLYGHPAELEDKLEIIHQANLGGSGGFRRGLQEAFSINECQYVILADDDAVLNISSLIKLYQKAKETVEADQPKMIGSIIKDIQKPDELQIYGDKIDRKNWKQEHCSANEAEFAGWWMACLPREIYVKAGDPLPYFLKWDDIEYGLRIKKLGFDTEILEEAHVLHPTWSDDSQRYSWQSYFVQRNKMITALIYGQKKGQNGLKLNILTMIKLLIKSRRSPLSLRLLALKDLFRNAEELEKDLTYKLPELKQIIKLNRKRSRFVAFWIIVYFHIKLYLQWELLAKKYQILLK
jgi:galactofuranosylgalactofuranosylrhamnosyl-N-acetylglucosaminyl-diphospho-decaprenol beta-1,5/1,6-galactofuranosyltransferase